MNPQRDHPFDDRKWWLNMNGACLHGPRPEPRNVDLFSHRDRAILMEAKRPVARRSLVEKYRPDWQHALTGMSARYGSNRPGAVEQTSQTGNVVKPNAGRS